MLRRRVKEALKRRFPILVRLRDALREHEPAPEPVSPFARDAGPRETPSPEPGAPGPGVEPAAPEGPGDALDPQAVQALLDDMVRPALQGDGGDIHLVKVEGRDVYVTLVGACHACPSATVTMRMGVERLLHEEFPTMGRLIEVGGAPFA